MESKKLKIVFFGTPEFAVASLDRLLNDGCDIAAVVTMPDKIAGRGHKLIQSDVKRYAVDHGLRVLQPEKLKSPEFVSELREINADLFIVIAFRMLPEVVWSMPPEGTFNLHASLLPRYRGAAPLNWALINGDTETGVTTFFLKHEIDTGDVIDRVSLPIGPDENAGSVHDRLMDLGADLVSKTIARIAGGSLQATPQDSLKPHVEPCPAPKIFKDTCHIDWARPAREVHNLVRGLSPYPAAWSNMEAGGSDKGTVKILATAMTDRPSSDIPGTAHWEGSERHPELLVDTATTQLLVTRLQMQGKKPMTPEELRRGLPLADLRLS